MAGLPQAPSSAPPSEDRPSPEAIAAAGEITILDAKGDKVPFNSLFEVKKNEDGISEVAGDILTTVIFIRHFYCGVCRAYVMSLAQDIPHNTPNRKLIIIGCGNPALIPKYISDTSCPFPIYAEPTGKLYSILGMTKTLQQGKMPKYMEGHGMISSILKGIWHALSWGSPLSGGNISQVGGEFLFVNGDLGWCHRMKTTTDHVDVEDLKKGSGY
ncbi:AhpC/TSA antioxidant enzyme-domain-containing protein [Terfezia claveryi]|nr:AhpC/TSA antioxidant enzyme-domain-containing protein [Terfezia claveryi]